MAESENRKLVFIKLYQNNKSLHIEDKESLKHQAIFDVMSYPKKNKALYEVNAPENWKNQKDFLFKRSYYLKLTSQYLKAVQINRSKSKCSISHPAQ